MENGNVNVIEEVVNNENEQKDVEQKENKTEVAANSVSSVKEQIKENADIDDYKNFTAKATLERAKLLKIDTKALEEKLGTSNNKEELERMVNAYEARIDEELKALTRGDVEKLDNGIFIERYEALLKNEPEKEIKLTLTQRIINVLKAIWHFICTPFRKIKEWFCKKDNNVEDKE